MARRRDSDDKSHRRCNHTGPGDHHKGSGGDKQDHPCPGYNNQADHRDAELRQPY